jgi:hypothetical protein
MLPRSSLSILIVSILTRLIVFSRGAALQALPGDRIRPSAAPIRPEYYHRQDISDTTIQGISDISDISITGYIRYITAIPGEVVLAGTGRVSVAKALAERSTSAAFHS